MSVALLNKLYDAGLSHSQVIRLSSLFSHYYMLLKSVDIKKPKEKVPCPYSEIIFPTITLQTIVFHVDASWCEVAKVKQKDVFLQRLQDMSVEFSCGDHVFTFEAVDTTTRKNMRKDIRFGSNLRMLTNFRPEIGKYAVESLYDVLLEHEAELFKVEVTFNHVMIPTIGFFQLIPCRSMRELELHLHNASHLSTEYLQLVQDAVDKKINGKWGACKIIVKAKQTLLNGE